MSSTSPHDKKNNSSRKVQSFWCRYLSSAQLTPETPLCEVFSFGDTRKSADALALLVLEGKKQATASLLWDYKVDDSLPQVGDLAIVTDGIGSPLCLIETVSVEVIPFKDVSVEFAKAEGEGDCSLSYWRSEHWEFFGRVCKKLGKERSLDMPVVCEHFRTVFTA
ncbi:MAG: ASCH domain-containing protein [Cyanobacteria bacterium J06614_10]